MAETVLDRVPPAPVGPIDSAVAVRASNEDGAVACLVLGNAYLAVACCVVSAWAIGTYLDTVYAGIITAARAKQRHDPSE